MAAPLAQAEPPAPRPCRRPDDGEQMDGSVIISPEIRQAILGALANPDRYAQAKDAGQRDHG